MKNQKERLIEILSRYFQIGDSYAYNLTRDKQAFSVGTMHLDDFEEFDENTVADIADHILANDVIVPPCKVGDTVYIISDYTNEILDRLIIEIIIKKDGYGFMFDTQSSWSDTDIGKTVFLTRENAEKALEERNRK